MYTKQLFTNEPIYAKKEIIREPIPFYLWFLKPHVLPSSTITTISNSSRMSDIYTSVSFFSISFLSLSFSYLFQYLPSPSYKYEYKINIYLSYSKIYIYILYFHLTLFIGQYPWRSYISYISRKHNKVQISSLLCHH